MTGPDRAAMRAAVREASNTVRAIIAGSDDPVLFALVNPCSQVEVYATRFGLDEAPGLKLGTVLRMLAAAGDTGPSTADVVEVAMLAIPAGRSSTCVMSQGRTAPSSWGPDLVTIPTHELMCWTGWVPCWPLIGRPAGPGTRAPGAFPVLGQINPSARPSAFPLPPPPSRTAVDTTGDTPDVSTRSRARTNLGSLVDTSLVRMPGSGWSLL